VAVDLVMFPAIHGRNECRIQGLTQMRVLLTKGNSRTAPKNASTLMSTPLKPQQLLPGCWSASRYPFQPPDRRQGTFAMILVEEDAGRESWQMMV
jgi:hypothetical protein